MCFLGERKSIKSTTSGKRKERGVIIWSSHHLPSEPAKGRNARKQQKFASISSSSSLQSQFDSLTCNTQQQNCNPTKVSTYVGVGAPTGQLVLWKKVNQHRSPFQQRPGQFCRLYPEPHVNIYRLVQVELQLCSGGETVRITLIS